MGTVVGSFAIAGATLAQIMHDFGSVEGDCDGILFGRLQHQTKSSIQDDEAGPVIPHEQITARVTGHYCTGRIQSFYDSTGRLNQSKLSHIVRERQGRGEDPVIGWYLGRRNTTLLPSMREAAVTSWLRSIVIAPTKLNEENTTNLSSPELKSPQISTVHAGEAISVSPGVTRKKHALQMIDSQTGMVKSSSLSVAGLDPPVSPSKSVPSGMSNSSAPPRKDRPVDLSTKAPLLPCFFVLFTESDSVSNAVRTHEYRAFQSLQNLRGISFEPLPVNIVNAGLSFRGFYDSFVPVASLPSWFNYDGDTETTSENDFPSNLPTGEHTRFGKSALLENNGRSKSQTNQDASGSSVARLGRQESSEFVLCTGLRVSQFENLYQQMLTRLERLSHGAYESSVALHQLARPT